MCADAELIPREHPPPVMIRLRWKRISIAWPQDTPALLLGRCRDPSPWCRLPTRSPTADAARSQWAEGTVRVSSAHCARNPSSTSHSPSRVPLCALVRAEFLEGMRGHKLALDLRGQPPKTAGPQLGEGERGMTLQVLGEGVR